MARALIPSMAAALLLAIAVTGCAKQPQQEAKHLRPLSYATLTALEKQGLSKSDPVLMRIYKEESELEVWKKHPRTGRYQHFKTYDICAWSGGLGPKKKEGDRQAPEGFYTVTPAQMNPNSSYWLSFNLGYPNTYDRAYGRTGSHLMVHGACSSAGCYSMEDEQIQEIYSLARDAFAGGQASFQVQAFPFRMTPENLARHSDSQHMAFWHNLKRGADHFEVTLQEPRVAVCDRRYVFNADAPGGGRFEPTGPCPNYKVPEAVAVAVAEKEQQDTWQVAKLVAEMRGDEEAVTYASVEQPAGAAAAVPAAASSLAADRRGPGGFFSRLLRFDSEPAEPRPTAEDMAAPETGEADGFERQALSEFLPPVMTGSQAILPTSWTAYSARPGLF